MTEAISVNDRLRKITNRFFEAPKATILTGSGPPFDISRPNSHDSKADFLAERDVVEESLAQAESPALHLVAGHDVTEINHDAAKAVVDRLNSGVRVQQALKRIERPEDLIVKNAAEVGISYVTILLMINLTGVLRTRKQELANEEAVFWRRPNRAPNYYARTIALRFARLIARETGKRPTLGTSRDGGHPSTDFGRALEEIFFVLDIKAHFRSPAKWAIAQLTEADLAQPVVNAFARFGPPSEHAPRPTTNIFANLTGTMSKDENP
jgi:hypothetical protein